MRRAAPVTSTRLPESWSSCDLTATTVILQLAMKRPTLARAKRAALANMGHHQNKITMMLRTRLYADPAGLFLHDAILAACRRHGQRTAIIDTSCGRRISYAEYGELVECAAGRFVAAGIRPGDVVGIFLCNSWEFAV